MAVIAVTGALTALLAASIGLVQNDIKKILAYSTVSQLGFMFAAVGCGAFAAGFMHVYTHAFFKACLFLGAGSVMHAVGAHGDADIRQLGGLKKYMPQTHWTFGVSCLAIAGVPLFSGFFSKDEILVGALSAGEYFYFAPWLGTLVFAMLVVGATMTAFYMFRLYFLTFTGTYRGGPHPHGHAAHAAAHTDTAHGHDDAHGGHAVTAQASDHAHGHGHDPHESPLAMTFPLMVLGFGAIFAGYVWVGIAHFEPWVEWLEPSLGKIEAAHSHSAPFIAMACGLAAAVIGIGLAWSWYFKGSETPAKLAASWPRLHAFLMDKWRVDELHDATILAASRLLARFLAAYDKYVVDGILSEVTTQTIKVSSYLFTRVQNGLVHAYGTSMALGLLAVTFYFMVPHAAPEVTPDSSGYTAKLTADKGLSYEYRWDFDGDGKFDSDWGPNPNAEHEFSPNDIHAYAIVFEPTATPRLGMNNEPQRLELRPGKSLKLSREQLGPGWQRHSSSGLASSVADDDGVVVEANGATVRKGSELVNGTVKVKRGEHVTIGDARLTVTGLVHTRLAIRNAFGMERVRTLELPVPRVEPRVQARIARLGGVQP
jgi:NADH-quinone oxidoreductase subunit L